MSLDQAHDILGWPSRDEILHPTGIGATIFTELLEEKLGKAISRCPDGAGVRVGVLASNPEATEAPIAIICDFPKKVSEETLQETQKLAWNFGRSSLLITIEPHIIRKWTCCEPPSASGVITLFDTPEIEPPIELDPQTRAFRSEQAAASLHWVELLTGAFFRQHEARFKPEKRADQMLLGNLKEVRQRLIQAGLNDDISHDLLARIIFIQFLFDRKDSEGKAALDGEELRRLHEEGILSRVFRTFGEILNSYEDTYALFRWLNTRFNGDLFPGKGTPEEQEKAWEREREQVTSDHLGLLARFVSGQERMRDGQLSLWPYYAFDAIPLEFISTIYEEFVKKEAGTGVHYTPAHVADLILDSVLPWQGQEWDLKVLDPACGSGVFLVKAFQRLIYRWKSAHPTQKIRGETLARLLEQNLFGVDLDPHAVRVASFSLYLAMCDEINPRDYWKEVHFPILRDRRLIAGDFFSEEQTGFCTESEPCYDLVIGNPPWGKNTATAFARMWQAKYDWPLSYGDIGPLFLAKALALTKPDGYVGLLQPASALLYNRTSAAAKFQDRIFQNIQVEEIVNFAALRHILFRDAIGPACAVMMRNSAPNGDALWYICPKLLRHHEDHYRIIIDPQDIHEVFSWQVKNAPWIWSTLLWGGHRDLHLIERFSAYTNLAQLEQAGIIRSREGIIRGRPSKEFPELIGRKILRVNEFPQNNSLFLSTEELDENTDPAIYQRDSVDFRAFELPQLILKKTWQNRHARFRAALVRESEDGHGVLCGHNVFLSIHSDKDTTGLLETICLALNSVVTVYYLLLTSGRFAMYRPEPQAEAFRSVPLPQPRPNLLDRVVRVEQVDEQMREVFALKEAEWLLIEDLAHFTLPDYKEGSDSPGRQRTRRNLTDGTEEQELRGYCDTFCKVLHATYGEDKSIGAVIYSEPTMQELLPVRMVSIYLNLPEVTATQVEPMESIALRARLTNLYQTMLSTEENRRCFYQRCVRTYDSISSPQGQSAIRINLIKPDQVRYWTRSMALRDADEVATDMMVWSAASGESQSDYEAANVA